MPYLTPDTPTANVGVSLVVPDTLLPVVFGALTQLLDTDHWEVEGSMSVTDTVDALYTATLEANRNMITPVYPSLVTIPVLQPIDKSAGMAIAASSNMITYGYMNGASAAGNWLKYNLCAQSGRYTLRWHSSGNTGNCIAQLLIDTVEIARIDLSNFGLNWNYFYTLPNVPIPTNGNHELQINALQGSVGGGWALYLQEIYFLRTGNL